MTVLASFPSSRNQQVPAEPQTLRLPVVADTELLVAVASDTRAYLEIRNLTNGDMVYYYETGDHANGFIVKQMEYKIIVNKGAVYVRSSVSGEIAVDVANG